MKAFDDLEICCPRLPQTTAQSLNLNAHNVLRRSTELANYRQSAQRFIQSNESPEDSVELHKSGQLKSLATKKLTCRDKKKTAKGSKYDITKNSEQRSTEFTKRKSTVTKKLSSVSNDRDLIVEMEERMKHLKHQLQMKEEEVKQFRRHLEHVEGIAAEVQQRIEANAFQSIESIAYFIHKEMDKAAAATFPTIFKFVDLFVTFAGRVVHSCTNNRKSVLQTEDSSVSGSLDPSIILRKDIDSLQRKLDTLRKQHTQLMLAVPPTNQLLERMRNFSSEQEEQLVELMRMQQIMEESHKVGQKAAIGIRL